MRIAAVVVTFNRSDLLLGTLQGLTRQTRPVDAIFLINNASTDGTEDLLKSEGWLNNHKVIYLKADTNLGGAGGFEKGMRAAYEAGYDWLWTMDDDVEPDVDALEVTLSYTRISE